MDVDRPEVRTQAGVLRGEAGRAGTAVFRGVPFAEPPVGALRFAAPRPARGWDGVRTATAFGTPPPQSAAFGMDVLAPPDTDDGDWLTLNVWTPDPAPGAGLPVMVWLFGGAYVIGMSGLPEYDGGRLAGEGRVVLVTLNYRIGIEGFAHIEGAPANRGLLDQVAALAWVRDNIRAFGGDPDRVTVFGESAGAGSLAALLSMPSAAGLFRRAVTQSVPGPFLSAPLAADIAGELAAELGLRPTVDDLSTVAPHSLPAAADTVGARLERYADRWGVLAHTAIPLAPVVDGDVLPRAPWEALAAGAARDIELVSGHTRDEYRLFMALDGTLTEELTEDRATAALLTFSPMTGGVAGSGGAGGSGGEETYRKAFPGLDAAGLYELVRSDWLFRMPSLHLAEAQIAGGGRAHVYELVWEAPGMGGLLGACHGLDVPLVFGNLRGGLPALLFGEEPPAAAEEVSALFRAAWTGFAAGEGPGWPAYDLDRRPVRLFDVRPTVTAYPEEVSRELWQGHVFGALPLLGPGA
ncbi:carboxylesterase/lipase family protein [Streptomyces ortus]|uniref:Carboxylic ester hydrolase n=1 Tax=Streptomyces ortus TaxID=2867268 RepID=A0ABT3V7R2_9ACTN|nr:carboxylesterase family protein [Streptomyces ortus]MCX4235898.1 carboxylesterase family protein [Streptomyces ortus]